MRWKVKKKWTMDFDVDRTELRKRTKHFHTCWRLSMNALFFLFRKKQILNTFWFDLCICAIRQNLLLKWQFLYIQNDLCRVKHIKSASVEAFELNEPNIKYKFRSISIWMSHWNEKFIFSNSLLFSMEIILQNSLRSI